MIRSSSNGALGRWHRLFSTRAFLTKTYHIGLTSCHSRLLQTMHNMCYGAMPSQNFNACILDENHRIALSSRHGLSVTADGDVSDSSTAVRGGGRGPVSKSSLESPPPLRLWGRLLGFSAGPYSNASTQARPLDSCAGCCCVRIAMGQVLNRLLDIRGPSQRHVDRDPVAAARNSPARSLACASLSRTLIS